MFEHIKQITTIDNDRYWDSITDADKKTFSPYMTNRFLSMNINWIDFIDEFQRYTINLLDKREVFLLYNEIIPKSRAYLKYVKSQNEVKIPSEVLRLLMLDYQCSELQTRENYAILIKTEEGQDEIFELLNAYGVQEKEQKTIKKELGIRR